MANTIVPGTVAAEPGTMTRAMLDVFESLLDPAVFAASETGLARFANAIALGWVDNVIASIDDTKYLQVNGGDIIGGAGGGGGGGAPTDAQYLVAASNGTLTAERVATNTASIVWDFATAGQAKATVPDATTTAKGIAELATDGEVAAGVVVQGNDSRLSNARVPTTHATSHQNGGSDEISVTGLSGLLADPQTPAGHGASHASDGSDPIPAATTTVRGTVELATSGETTAGLAVQASDTRLSDSRTPTAHASTHHAAGSDPVDVTDLAGFPGGGTTFLRDDGTFAAPAGGTGLTQPQVMARAFGGC